MWRWGRRARNRFDRRRSSAVAILLALCLGLGAVGCSGEASVDKSQVTLTIRTEGPPERRLLNQIYAQALKSAGYRVKEAPETLEAKFRLEGLKSTQIDGYAEYLSTSLYYDFGVEIEDIPTNTQGAYDELKRELRKEGLTAFPPAPYSIADAVGFLRKTAEKHHLEKISDLKGVAEKMIIKAPTYCHVSVECLGGIEVHYHTAFEGMQAERSPTSELTWWRPEPKWRYQVLEDEVSDASILYNTDGRLATEKNKFVILEDDKHIFPAGNFVWVTSPEVVEEAGPDYEKAIVAAQKGLTLGVIQTLNARMEAGKAPARVAAEYLKSIHYKGA